MLTLNAKDVAQAGLKAFEDERLGFQSGDDVCMYRYEDGKSVCVIGASIPEEFIQQYPLRNSCRVDTLIADGLIDSDNPAALSAMQEAHDNLCSNAYRTDEDVQKFVDLLKHFASR